MSREAEIPGNLMVKSDRAGWIASIWILGPLFLILAAAPLIWLALNPWAVLPLLPFLGAQIYKVTILMHDCAHRTLFDTHALNKKVGILCGWLLGSDFDVFAKEHWTHHKFYGQENDPQGRDYLDLRDKSQAFILWHLVRPLFGYNLFKVFIFSPVGQKEKNPGNQEVKPGSNRLTKLLPIGITQLCIAAIASGFGQVWSLVFLYPAAAASFALFFSQTRGFCEHIADVESESDIHVRTHLPNFFDRLFFYTLNFNYHVEHHMYPAVPSHHLPEVYKLVKDKTHGKKTISNSIFSTIRQRLKEARS